MKTMLALALAMPSLISAQALPKLDPAQPVDIRIQSVRWHPHGQVLLYSREESNGLGLGVYQVGQPEGKVVLHVGKSATWSSDWFEGSACALVTVEKKVQAANGPAKELDLYVLDAAHETCSEVFSRTLPADVPLSVDPDLSPGLTHAILTIREGKATYHAVLPIGGGRVVTSPDIDKAEAQGFSGPSWSRDGTALYSKGGGQGISFELNGDSSSSRPTVLKGAFKIMADKAAGANDLGQTLILNFTPPAPPVGDPAFEVVPSNGVLREIRSPGPWQEQPGLGDPFRWLSRTVPVNLKTLQGSSKSLWLVEAPAPTEVPPNTGTFTFTVGGDGAGPQEYQGADPGSGVLISASADQAYLAPDGDAVAYVTDGALFVRAIRR